jgi:hypothetical protein
MGLASTTGHILDVGKSHASCPVCRIMRNKEAKVRFSAGSRSLPLFLRLIFIITLFSAVIETQSRHETHEGHAGCSDI